MRRFDLRRSEPCVAWRALSGVKKTPDASRRPRTGGKRTLDIADTNINN
jgi:hypothetical protein